MRTLSLWLCGVSLALGAAFSAAAPRSASAAPAAGAEQPAQVVQNVAQRFLKDQHQHRTEYSKDPQPLRAAVDRDVLPYFDVDYAARLVLGRYWRQATPDQRKRFIAAFENSMFANYGSALLEFRSDRLSVVPRSVSPGARNAIVDTVIHRDDGSTVKVNFALHQTPQGWKAWDVIIEGISYVKSFRDDFGAQIEAQGLDAVIQRLEHGAKPASLPSPGGRKS
jgi:phospholipid transport system substrate-binding protein